MDLALLMFIGVKQYFIERLPGDPPCWRLMQPNGEIYDCHLDKHGLHCTCGDGVFRREGTRDNCKHVQALKELRLI